ncbi:integrase core domain-containing protein, partial [Halomonas piscis]|uniref:integrase core domain-containing protein n=1 Tax=Halomonas piscis TaxID=3031727 RepID=UPI0028995260
MITPFSESQFKTSKYQPDYPGRFESIVHARQWCSAYVDWYNLKHHHSRLAGFTPEQVFTGRYRDIIKIRQQALDDTFEAHPERLLRGRPKVAIPPESVSINPVQPDDDDPAPYSVVNFPTLSAAKVTPSIAAQGIVQQSGGRDEQRTHRQTLDRQAQSRRGHGYL